ncbi:SAM-dependent methyltransferase [Gaeumannomyces tritici R3-111a-1]|uniref:SAM-dependent methyltransferase n=1 Tax=Gaeumannomyces tritici (strain R3-111a-1) TaxID=644352 RepID=J3NQL2_GAET3|nr:SAM-dependent methyltransferase [Gaeumannomyces tritici R3-111a-1]EJT78468.1 SAM-dependent methyltransferase [Gaeumannomyces tritici R3-111a-1]
MADETPAALIPTSRAAQIASYSPLLSDPVIEVAQARHRINLVNTFASISPLPQTTTSGVRFLEVGCGQGNCTTVLAAAAGPSGSVTALDPAPPTYGAPFTLAGAQAVVSASEVGPRITWHNATTLDALLLADTDTDTAAGPATTTRCWDVAVLAHSAWYFSSPHTLRDTLAALRGRVGAVWLAEYALSARRRPAAWPHVLAALARGSLEAHRESGENIQTPLSPPQIRDAAAAAGWGVAGEAVLVPDEGLLDGRWETGAVVGDGFLADVDAAGIRNERVKAVLRSARDATIAAMQAVGGVKKVETMDVWVVVLKERSGQ